MLSTCAVTENDDDYAPIGKKDFFAMAMSKINVENEQYAYSKGGWYHKSIIFSRII